MERYRIRSWWNEWDELPTVKDECTNDRAAAINALCIYANHPDCISCSIIDYDLQKCIMNYDVKGVE